MKTLAAAVNRKEAGGHPLPPVFDTFARHRISFRAGEVSTIAGQPGAGKSALALWHATQWVARHGLRGIYFSADSSELVQAARSLAMVSPFLPTEEAEQRVESGDDTALQTLHDELDGLAWSFEPDITYEVMELEVQAFIETWGTTPSFIVVDNLTDVEGQADDEWATLRRVMKNLVVLARVTGAHVLVLHHTSEDFKDDPCPPRKAIQGKVSQKQSLVLTVGGVQNGKQPVCPVKNRYAPPHMQDKYGHMALWLPVNPTNFHYSEAA